LGWQASLQRIQDIAGVHRANGRSREVGGLVKVVSSEPLFAEWFVASSSTS
jgi:hypothetical protein